MSTILSYVLEQHLAEIENFLEFDLEYHESSNALGYSFMLTSKRSEVLYIDTNQIVVIYLNLRTFTVVGTNL